MQNFSLVGGRCKTVPDAFFNGAANDPRICFDLLHFTMLCKRQLAVVLAAYYL